MPWIRHRRKRPSPLWPFEAATLPPGAVQPGLVVLAHPTMTTLGLWFLLTWHFVHLYGFIAFPLALALTRLALIDISTYLLPNLYTYPLISGGLVWAWAHGYGPYATVLVAVMLALRAVVIRHPGLTAGIGGGDFALLAALCCWLEPQLVFFAMAGGCLLWLPFTFLTPRRPVPLGVPIILGWAGLGLIFARLGLPIAH